MSKLIAVLDARELYQDGVIVGEWARCYGIDPTDVPRIELHYDGRLYARVHAWARNENGDRYWDGTGNRAARRRPYDVTIIATGPQGIADRIKARADVQANACPALAPVLAVVRLQLKPMRAAYDRRRRARTRRGR